MITYKLIDKCKEFADFEGDINVISVYLGKSVQYTRKLCADGESQRFWIKQKRNTYTIQRMSKFTFNQWVNVTKATSLIKLADLFGHSYDWLKENYDALTSEYGLREYSKEAGWRLQIKTEWI